MVMAAHDDLQNRVLAALLKGPATSKELAQALGAVESEVLKVLDNMRKNRMVAFMGGNWSVSS